MAVFVRTTRTPAPATCDLRQDRGSALPMALVATLAVSAFGGAGLSLAEFRSQAMRMQAVADVAALAAADQGLDCSAAAAVAGANGAVLLSCVAAADSVRVVVTAFAPSANPWLPAPRARARAGF